MENDGLKEALLERAPALAEDYKRFVRGTFETMRTDLGDGLKGASNSWTWGRTFDAIRGNLYKDVDKSDYRASSLSMGEYAKIPYKINEEALEKNAQAYGERVALEWYNKMRSKLGDLRITAAYADAGGDVVIKGQVRGRDVVVNQQRIINVSSRGLLFHQFPARIYVDGKFMSEAAYRKLVGGAPARKPSRTPSVRPSLRGIG